MKPLIECVPNFSEGCDRDVIDAIAASIRGVPGAALLHVDIGEAANRTVMTFVGSPDAVSEAAFRAIRSATERIDMRHQQGVHPRIGAADVCPFIPLRGATLADCAHIAASVGARVATELLVPVYLYGDAARTPTRRSLARVRVGQVEALLDRLQTPDGAPDLGPSTGAHIARTGAIAIGARKPLIAFNVNLNTRDVRKARRIAAQVREGGRDGLPAVRAIGWFIDEYRCCQVSLNLVDYERTPPHVAFDTICRLAEQVGVRVTGAELIGLSPLAAMRTAGQHYLRRQGASPGEPDDVLIEVAAQSMGLRSIRDFSANEHILERRLRRDGPLVSATVREMVDRVSSATPTPGGGSVTALCGAMSAALASMVTGLARNAGKEDDLAALEATAIEAQALKDEYLNEIDEDTQAFARYLAARRMPRRTPAQIARRDHALKETTQAIIAVPLAGMRRAERLLRCAEHAAQVFPDALSDVGVTVQLALAAAEGSWGNIAINRHFLNDSEAAARYLAEADDLLERIRTHAETLRETVRRALI
ncbi:MAG: glutamate formimidoyltransferase [Myxococcota bacterium]